MTVEMLAVERERAKERKSEATGHKEKFPEAESGQARDKAAEKVNADVSGRKRGKNLKKIKQRNGCPKVVKVRKNLRTLKQVKPKKRPLKKSACRAGSRSPTVEELAEARPY